MKRVALASDLHLNEASEDALENFWKQLAQTKVDALLITGDISEGANFYSHFKSLDLHAQCPIYFIFGNHDYYGHAIEKRRLWAAKQAWKSLCYLPSAGIIPLGQSIALLGQEGWADGRKGDFWKSSITPKDFLYIDDLKVLDKIQLLKRLHQLADTAVDRLKTDVQKALPHFSTLWIATHVPPFVESALHENQQADDHWAPHMVCGALGAFLYEIALASPDKKFFVICGHAHSEAQVKLLPNLQIYTLGASPTIATFLEIE